MEHRNKSLSLDQSYLVTNMKFYIVVFALATLAVALAAKPKSARCSTEEDCNEDECCIANVYGVFQKGYCKPLAVEGKPCSFEDDKVEYFGGKYFYACPCKKGLDCIAEKIITKDKSTYKWNAKCTMPTTSTSEEPTEEPEVTTGSEGGDSGEGGNSGEGGDGGEGTEGGESGESTTGSEELVVEE